MFRDDHDAMLARLHALDEQVARFTEELALRDQAIALRDTRIAELEAQLARLQRESIDREATLVDYERRKLVQSKPIANSKHVTVNSPEARAEADRLLAEGVERYRTGDKQGAQACFQRGLELVPNHAQILRAQRRYT